MHAYTLVNVRIALLNPVQSARSAPLYPGKLKQEGFKINFIVYTRTPATPGPAHAHQFSAGQFSLLQFRSVGAAAEVDTDGNGPSRRARRASHPTQPFHLQYFSPWKFFAFSQADFIWASEYIG